MTSLRVLTPVDFNNQSRPRCKEIHDIRAKRFLPIKLDSMQLLPTQARPEQILRIGHIAAEITGRHFQVVAVVTQGKSP